MRARLYDPVLGRFLQPDTLIPGPTESQSYNRYSYCGNNPVSHMDPSGHFLKKLFKGVRRAVRKVSKFVKRALRNPYVRMIGSIAASAFLPGYGGAFLSGLIGSGGDLQAGFASMLSAGMFHGLHDMAKGWGKVFAHGAAGGISSELHGGKFKDGFLSAGATQAVSWKFENALSKLGDGTTHASRAKNAAVAALIGGTASAIGGGKFKNGAMSGAFSRLFNDLYIINNDDGTVSNGLTGEDVDLEKGGRDALYLTATAGGFLVAAPVSLAVRMGLWGRGALGIINKNRLLRFGWGKRKGELVLRVAGDVVAKIKPSNPHYDPLRSGRPWRGKNKFREFDRYK